MKTAEEWAQRMRPAIRTFVDAEGIKQEYDDDAYSADIALAREIQNDALEAAAEIAGGHVMKFNGLQIADAIRKLKETP